MPGGTLFVSRNTAIFSWMQDAFEESGFRDITLTSLDKKELASQLIELNPKTVFIDSTLYSGVTPYMTGELLVKFPKLKIHIVNSGDFPDSLAVRFIFHGAKSYIDFRDGKDECLKALKLIYSGQGYYSPGIDRYFNEVNEMLSLKSQVTDREWQVLFLICNGFSEKQIKYNLAISRRTVDTHINNLHKVLDAKNRIELLVRALNLGWIKKEHLCFHGTDVEIPSHPSKNRDTTAKRRPRSKWNLKEAGRPFTVNRRCITSSLL